MTSRNARSLSDADASRAEFRSGIDLVAARLLNTYGISLPMVAFQSRTPSSTGGSCANQVPVGAFSNGGLTFGEEWCRPHLSVPERYVSAE